MQDVDKVLERYRQRLASADDARRHAEHTIKRLRDQLYALESQLAAVRQQVVDADDLVEQLADARATNRALRVELKQAQAGAPQRAQLQIQKLIDRLAEARAANQELKREALDRAGDSAAETRLTKQLREAQTANRELADELQRARAETSRLQDSSAENRRLRVELKQAQASAPQRAQLQVQKLNNRLRDARAVNQELKREALDRATANRELADELQRARDTLGRK